MKIIKRQELSLCLGLCMLASLGLEGCGSVADDQPDLGQVSGQVTLDGQPLAAANIYFQPVEGGRNSTATTDDQGNYVLDYLRDLKGAKIGQHKVRISTFVEPVKGDDGAVENPGKKELVPDKYNKQTELEKEVKAGENVINIEITSS